jgi:hypothetical protein
MANNYIGNRPAPVQGGKTLVSKEINVSGGSIHNTVVVTPNGEVKNDHLTFTPSGGGKKTSIW